MQPQAEIDRRAADFIRGVYDLDKCQQRFEQLSLYTGIVGGDANGLAHLDQPPELAETAAEIRSLANRLIVKVDVYRSQLRDFGKEGQP